MSKSREDVIRRYLIVVGLHPKRLFWSI